MSPRPLDTTPSTWASYASVLDRMGGPARLNAAVELSESVRELRIDGIRRRHPELSMEQAVARWVLEEYGLTLPDVA